MPTVWVGRGVAAEAAKREAKEEVAFVVRLRLRRTGAKKRPSYRVVAAEDRAPRDGAFLETVGYYNPLTDPATIVIDEEKALKWLRRGAQPSAPVVRLLTALNIMAKFKALPHSQPPS